MLSVQKRREEKKNKQKQRKMLSCLSRSCHAFPMRCGKKEFVDTFSYNIISWGHWSECVNEGFAVRNKLISDVVRLLLTFTQDRMNSMPIQTLECSASLPLIFNKAKCSNRLFWCTRLTRLWSTTLVTHIHHAYEWKCMHNMYSTKKIHFVYVFHATCQTNWVLEEEKIPHQYFFLYNIYIKWIEIISLLVTLPIVI